MEKANQGAGAQSTGRIALLLGFAIFALLWIAHLPCSELYFPTGSDIPLLADGSLLAPGASWQDWFTRGYSRFWDLYPDWPVHGREATETDFTRPSFQFLIYLTHFVLGRDWASYQLINCFAVAGMAAAAYQIAQAVLGLRTGPSLVAAILVVLSPPVLYSWLMGVAYAIEPLATVLVAAAFLAVIARRDLLGLALLFAALLTKENTLWAPFAAAITIMLRPNRDDSLRRRFFTAALMLLPVAMWLGLRFSFFDGVGSTYVTAGYTPLAEFLKLTFNKLTHVHYLFITHTALPHRLNREPAVLMLDRGTALLVYALLFLWALRILPEAVNRLRHAIRESRWPAVDNFFLVTLWAATALAFHFAVPLRFERYATSVVIFAWPALVAEVERRGKTIIWLSVAVICVASLTRSSYRVIERDYYACQNKFKSMNAALRQVPAHIQKIYVVTAGNMPYTNPKYLQLVLDLPAEIVRLGEISWHCSDSNDRVALKHHTANGVVSMSVTLPTCASFLFYTNRFSDIANGHLDRSATISYEFADVYPVERRKTGQPRFSLGQKMTAHIRPNGPARFIIGHVKPGELVWFDTP